MSDSFRKLTAAALLFGLLAAATARAADAPSTLNPCDFKPLFDKLHAIQSNGDQDYLEAIRAQLQVRKALLRSVIDCALEDLKHRKETLKTIRFDDPRTLEDIARSLDASEEFYARKREAVGDLGIRGTQDLAQELASWRASNYVPLMAREDALLLWSQDQSLFSKAEARFDQVRPVVMSLKLISNDGIQATFKDAEKAFAEAKTKNEAAKAAIQKGDPAANALVRRSLEPLSGIYKMFLELSDEIKKIVP